MNLENLSKQELFIVKWQYGILGDFQADLLRAIRRADKKNLHKLSLGFPDEVEGYKNYGRVDGWWEEIKKKAKIDE